MINLILILILTLLPSLSWGANCSATTNAVFYVDNVGGDDTNDGLSTSAPWQHCPGDGGGSWYQVGGSNCTLKAGDMVVFKGNVKYTVSTTGASSIGINISWAGSGDADTSRIIYDGDSGDWPTRAIRWASGTEKAIVDGNQTVASVFNIASGSVSYITINNFEIRNGRHVYSSSGRNTGSGGGFLIDNTNGANYLNVSKCYLHHAGISDYSLWAASGTTPAGGSENCPVTCPNGCDYGSGHCFYNLGGDNINIHHNTFTDCGTTAILTSNGSYNKVYNNSFNGRNAYVVWFQQSTDEVLTDSEIHDNILYDHVKGLTTADCQVAGKTCPICIGDGHANWFFFGGSYHRMNDDGMYGSWKNTRIYNNTVYNSYTTAYNEMHSAGIFQYAAETMTCWDGLYVFNNVLFNIEKAGLSVYTRCYIEPEQDKHYNCTNPINLNCDGTNNYRGCEGCLRNVYILNNTIYSPVSSMGPSITLGDGTGISTHNYNVNIKNNILHQGSSGISIAVPYRANMSGTVGIDYNFYYNPNPSPNDPRVLYTKLDLDGSTSQVPYYWTPYQGSDSWTTTLLYDTHTSILQDFRLTTPLSFMNTTVPTTGQSFDLRPSAISSPVVKAGENLTSLCSNTSICPDGAATCALCNDRNGIARPSSGAWDIGAYQYGSYLPTLRGVTGVGISIR